MRDQQRYSSEPLREKSSHELSLYALAGNKILTPSSVYAYLQRGEERAAKHALDELQANPPDTLEDLAGAYAVGAIPARYALERSRWAEAAALTP